MSHSPRPWAWKDGWLRSAEGLEIISGYEWEVPSAADKKLISSAPEMLVLLRRVNGECMCEEYHDVETNIAKFLAEIDADLLVDK